VVFREADHFTCLGTRRRIHSARGGRRRNAPAVAVVQNQNNSPESGDKVRPRERIESMETRRIAQQNEETINLSLRVESDASAHCVPTIRG
jgi:hypothetical protein